MGASSARGLLGAVRTRSKTTLTFSVTLTLDEAQARALDALVGYGIDPFLKVFYEKLGRHYMEPFELGLRSLFKAIDEQVEPELHRIKCARKSIAQWDKP